MSPADLDDLTAELSFHADRATTGAAGLRLAGVRTRIRARRRRRAGAAITLAAAAVAAVTLVPALTSNRADRPPAPASSVHPADPLVFPTENGGDPLVVSRVGAAGQTALTFTYTPSDTNLALSSFCRFAPGVPNSTSLNYDVSINGKVWFTTSGCDLGGAAGADSTQFGDEPAINRADWAQMGIRPGRPATVEISAHGDAAALRAGSPGMRLGVGFYQLSGPRVRSQGFVIKKLYEADGHHYRLGGYRTAEASATERTATLHVPAQHYPVVLISGTRGTQAGYFTVLVDGQEQSMNDAGVVTGGQPLSNARAHTIEVRLSGHRKGTTMMVGYYVRIS